MPAQYPPSFELCTTDTWGFLGYLKEDGKMTHSRFDLPLWRVSLLKPRNQIESNGVAQRKESSQSKKVLSLCSQNGVLEDKP